MKLIMLHFSQLPWLIVTISAFCNCLGNILIKQSRLASNNSSSFIVTITSPWFIAGLIAYCIGLLLFAKALDKLPISIVVPTSQGIGFILVTFISYWLFKETLTFNQVIAVSLIFAGIVVIAYQ
ncbi:MULTISPECIES: SMR family transporter [unclassified Nostoc]|uniref:DMT family transporter n=1 Tax=unclassified Nostoc TaxID=2593658 RepID=UPI0013D7E579|nr:MULTISPECIES: SMR family transporter [unclassified Nostoc]MBE8998371.1 EamA family transporter [Nostoc sp. LEGE 12447]NEU81676.1 EamA family transporter [Nostoc sp. UIC 10630]